MKIKRFEATSMSGALKLIKQEFGDEAVILSAKSIKKSSGLLSGKRPAKVVVTAAVDTPSVPSQKKISKGQQEKPLQSIPKSSGSTDRIPTGKLQFLKRFNPITRTGQQKLQSKFVGIGIDARNDSGSQTVYQKMVSKGVNDAIANDYNDQVASLVRSGFNDPTEIRNALSHVIQATKIVERPKSSNHPNSRIVVLVGPSGAGKTTTAAKLAAMQVKQLTASAAFLSLDDRRVAGCAELERYAKILGIPLEKAHEPDEIGPILDKLCDYPLVVVDTPGLTRDDRELRDHLGRLIAAMPNAEVHLLLNADSQDGALAKAICFFKTVGIQFLAFTRLDWADTMGGLINQASEFDMPITYLSNSSKVSQDTQWASAEGLADMLLANTSQADSEKHGADFIGTGLKDGNGSIGINYVANRNSDIFHKYDCQSAKRINSENMVEFDDPADAMGRNFKPCRMCCSELHISKPIQRVAYKYASSR